MTINDNKICITTKSGMASINLKKIAAIVVHNNMTITGDDERCYMDLHMDSGTIFTSVPMDLEELDEIEQAWWSLE